MSEMDIAQGGAVAEEVSDTRAKVPLPENCYACGAKTHGPYCYACGQKNDDCRRSIAQLLYESVGDFVSYDGRVLRTVRSVLSRPGRHVRRYGDGQRSPYSPPIRFFLVISFLFFTTMWATDTLLVTFQPTIEESADGTERRLSVEGGILKRAEVRHYTEEERDALREMLGMSADRPRDIKAAAGADPAEVGIGEADGGAVLTVDMEPASEEEVGTLTINGRELTGTELVERLLQIAENPAGFNSALNDWIPRIMILMIPLMAISAGVFIRGRDALLYDQLLLSLNTHAIAFLILLTGLILGPVVPAEIFGFAFFLGIPIYYLLGLKGAFGRGWTKTVFATVFVLFLYAIVGSIALGFAVFDSFTTLI